MASPGRINVAITPRYPTVYYCDPGDIQRRMTVAGTKSRTRDYGDGSIIGEAGAIEDVIWQATEMINFYCFKHYRPEDMAQSTFVNRLATAIACYYLSIRRGNTAPGPFVDEYNMALKMLELIHSNNHYIPGVPVRATNAPYYANVRVNQAYATHRVRVEGQISDSSPATTYSRALDYISQYDYVV